MLDTIYSSAVSDALDARRTAQVFYHTVFRQELRMIDYVRETFVRRCAAGIIAITLRAEVAVYMISPFSARRLFATKQR